MKSRMVEQTIPSSSSAGSTARIPIPLQHSNGQHNLPLRCHVNMAAPQTSSSSSSVGTSGRQTTSVNTENSSLDILRSRGLVSEYFYGSPEHLNAIGIDSSPQQHRCRHLPSPEPSPSVSGVELLLHPLCICAKKAKWVCKCKKIAYCSQKCQLKNKQNHQKICKAKKDAN